MKYYFFKTCILLFYFTVSAQAKFEKGYFIDNNNKRTECLIKNENWISNPSEFVYRLNGSSHPNVYNISFIKEFGIYNASTFERHKVKIDVSSNNLHNLSLNRNPIWVENVVFLKILIIGKATLYGYKVKGKNRFFYRIGKQNPEQLVYKQYKLKSDNIATNLTYINQLYKNINCNNYTIDKIKAVKYKRNDLVNYFNEYNMCSTVDYSNNILLNSENTKVNFKIISGLNISNFSLISDKYSEVFDIDLDSKLSFRIGFEAEFILPFYNHKLSFFIEPVYTYYNQNYEKEFQFGGIIPRTGTIKVNSDLDIIETSIGIRHYFLLNKQTKLFIDAGYTLSNFINPLIKYEVTPDSFVQPEINRLKAASNFFGGVGIFVLNKVNLEARYQSPKNSLVHGSLWETRLNSFTFIVGYSFL